MIPVSISLFDGIKYILVILALPNFLFPASSNGIVFSLSFLFPIISPLAAPFLFSFHWLRLSLLNSYTSMYVVAT